MDQHGSKAIERQVLFTIIWFYVWIFSSTLYKFKFFDNFIKMFIKLPKTKPNNYVKLGEGPWGHSTMGLNYRDLRNVYASFSD